MKLWMKVCLCFFLFTASASAQIKGVAFNTNDAYDIFVQISADDSYVVKRVNILEVKSINGAEFLVIKNTSGLQASKDVGYIRFSSVTAILPSSTFTITPNISQVHY